MKQFFVFLCFAVICVGLFTGNVYASQVEGYPDFLPPNEGEYGVVYVAYRSRSLPDIVSYFKIYSKDANTANYFNTLELTDGKVLVLKSNANCFYEHYTYSTYNARWEVGGAAASAGVGSTTLSSNINSLVYTSKNIYDATTGDLVFPAPPVTSTLEEVTLEGLEALQTETLGTMKILTVCGVGLLALLIGLVILPKVLYRFL